MALITRTYSFSDGTTAYGSQVDSEIGNIVNTINSLDQGNTTWTNVKVTTLSLQTDTNIGGHRLTNLGTPTTTGDAAVYPIGASQLASGFGSRVLQTVVTTISGAQVSTTNTAFTGTNVTASITLASSSSKVRVSIISTANASGTETLIWTVLLNGSVNLGDSSGGLGLVVTNGMINFSYVSSPASAGVVSYSISIRSIGGATVSCPAASFGAALYGKPTIVLEELG